MITFLLFRYRFLLGGRESMSLWVSVHGPFILNTHVLVGCGLSDISHFSGLSNI